MKVSILLILGLFFLVTKGVQAQDSTNVTTVIDSTNALVFADSLVTLFSQARAVHKIERFDQETKVEESAKSIMLRAYNLYGKLKYLHGLESKTLFSEKVFDEGIVASRELRAFPITLQFQKDKTALYNTNKPHVAICNGACGKCVTPDAKAIEHYQRITQQNNIK